MHTWGWGLYGWLEILSMVVVLAILVGLVLFILWLVRRISGPAAGYHGSTSSAPFSAKEILQQRYARGEITRDQYREMLSELDK